MKKLGVRPKPFRSRFLALLPLGVALYMFAWPAVRRLFIGHPSGPFQGFTSHLMTNDFWQTFPGPTIAILTFVTCGFAAVYFLGAKGFCTYGCPYGALFGPIDSLSIGRIVVNDGCEQCGHCTATCTSNVRVHEEVKLYGMVVDPGCMKCTDCVSVCPKGALRFAFARPSLFRRVPKARRARRYDLPLTEELFLATICLFATVTFFRLYDGPPLLMSAGLGGLTAFASLKLWHLIRRPNVGIQNVVFKSGGRLDTAGWWFAGLAIVWLTFTAHSAFVQWHRVRGIHFLSQSEAARADVLSGTLFAKPYSQRHYLATAEAHRHLSLADRWGLVNVLDVKLALSWAELIRGDHNAAAEQAFGAVAIAPAQSLLTLENLFVILVSGRRFDEAIDTMKEKLELPQPSPLDRFRLALLFETAGRPEEAVDEYRRLIADEPGFAIARGHFGDLLRRRGHHDEALAQLREAVQLFPEDAGLHAQLGLTYLAKQETPEALRSLERALELDPSIAESPIPVRGLINELRGALEE